MAQKIKWLISACENKLSRTNDNVKNRKEDRTGEEELRINGIKRKEGRKEGREAVCSAAIFAVRPSFPLLARLFHLCQVLSVLFLESRQVVAQSWTVC